MLLLLLLPAAVLTIITLVVPTVNTVGTSMRAEFFLDRGEAEDVGFDNFGAVLGDGGFGSALWFSPSPSPSPGQGSASGEDGRSG